MANALDYVIYALTSSSVFFSFLVFVIYSRNNFNRGIVYKGISILLLTLSFRFFTIHLYINHLISDYPHFLLLNNLASRLGLPILYFVLLSSLYSWTLKWFDALHLVLPILFLVHFSNVLFGSVTEKLALIQEMELHGYEIIWHKGIFDSLYLINAIKYLTLYGYTFLILTLLLWPSNFKRLPKHLLTFFKLALVFLFVNLIPSLISHAGVDIWNYASLIGAASTLLFTFGVFFVPDFLFPIDSVVTERKASTHESSSTEVAEIYSHLGKSNQLFERIEAYFKDKRPYLDQDFSLSHVEKYLGISGRYISEAIKEETQLNFSAYVNQARIAYLKESLNREILSKESNFSVKTMDEIANELGFRSVNSFYQVVRKTHGCTPKELLETELRTSSYDLATGSGI